MPQSCGHGGSFCGCCLLLSSSGTFRAPEKWKLMEELSSFGFLPIGPCEAGIPQILGALSYYAIALVIRILVWYSMSPWKGNRVRKALHVHYVRMVGCVGAKGLVVRFPIWESSQARREEGCGQRFTVVPSGQWATQRPLSSSFLGLPYTFLNKNHKLELLWCLYGIP